MRDFFLGVENKDRDFVVIASSYEDMKNHLLAKNAKIYLESPAFFTIRCKLEPYGDCDFRLGRIEGGYSDGRHPDNCSIASSIEQDLFFRDFTVNAIAKDEDGNIIDPFGGQADIKRMKLQCVGNTEDRLNEDFLRLLRAFRFMITKGFKVSEEIHHALLSHKYVDGLENVSIERIREELYKCFRHDTARTISYLGYYSYLSKFLFSKNLWLKPTLEN